ncbi:MAG: phosphoribosylaminoimidazolesuccinocarboxamide synthase [Phycisphaerales bacterium]|nr:phosphoribosylaminoimidazolesuccinocarboxamide synthase [Phycisphaerales bacterium]
MPSHAPLLETDLRLPGKRQGKVRDVYDLPTTPGQPPRLLIVATDRISAFDVVMPTPLPGKGRLLTTLSTFWLGFIADRGLAQTHLLSTDVSDLPDEAFTGARTTREDLRGRSMICRKTRVIPVECVARGYLEGSGWKEYQATGQVCGVRLPSGLRQCDKLPAPIFTPATKEEQGKHDENIDFARACDIAGEPVMTLLRDTTLAIYQAAADYARERGIIIADTKFEFGLPLDETGTPSGAGPIVIDEALTPDSSRFWPADRYEPGHAQPSFDKQFLREYLERLVAQGKWNKQAPGPAIPDDIAHATLDRYREATQRLANA